MSDKANKTLQTVGTCVGIASGGVSLAIGLFQLVTIIKETKRAREEAKQQRNDNAE